MSWADVPVGKSWADEDEELDFDNRIESAVDKDGIKTVTTYEERGGNSYKITSRVKVEKVNRRMNVAVKAREGIRKFGLVAKGEDNPTARSPEEVPIEPTKRLWGVQQDEMDKFFEQEAEKAIEGRRKEGASAWKSSAQRREEGDLPDLRGEEKLHADSDNRDASGKYVPPSLRKGGGGPDRGSQGDEFTLRVTNLSDDVREGDLHELFGAFGQLSRVFLAKDPETKRSKGFAFVTFWRKHEAEKAIEKLDKHGYDNLILSVSFAQPRKN